MKHPEILNQYIPFGTYKAINLGGIIFSKMPLTPAELRHEQIHTHQMLEMLIIGFYIWYIVEWTIRIIQYHGNMRQAYFNICFEREAYAKQSTPRYLGNRPHYASLRYLKKS